MVTSDSTGWRDDIDHLRAAVHATALSVGQIPDALDRVAAASGALRALEEQAVEIQAVRLGAVADLRAAGHSYDHIAYLTGLSKARVAQLSRAAKA